MVVVVLLHLSFFLEFLKLLCYFGNNLWRVFWWFFWRFFLTNFLTNFFDEFLRRIFLNFDFLGLEYLWSCSCIITVFLKSRRPNDYQLWHVVVEWPLTLHFEMAPKKSFLLGCSKLLSLLKSVNSNFTLAVHSPKPNHAKTHFLSHFGEKKKKLWLDRDLNPQSVDQKLIMLSITL